jgi:PAS domain S-box-containing protein
MHFASAGFGASDLLPFVAGLLQIAVAGYALRLNRLFGSKRVGWWLVGAFTLQAFLSWFHATGIDMGASLRVDVLYVLLSIMLLAAMVHSEKLQKVRLYQEQQQKNIRVCLEEIVEQKTAELMAANRELNLKVERQQQHEDELRLSEKHYRVLFDENPQPMWVYDRQSLQFLKVNAAASSQYGLRPEKLSGMTIKDIRPAEDIPRFLEDNAKPTHSVENRGCWRYYKCDGTIAEVEITVTDLMYQDHSARLVLATDVTERLELERQLRQAQKMEAIGQLAGGVAHDFNNILTVMQGYADLLLRRNQDATTADHLKQISAAGERAASLTRQLLAFSRRHHLQLVAVDLNEIVTNLSKMLRRLIGEDIVLETAFSEVPGVMADPGMIEQIILNLAVNARDAMKNGGVVTVTTSIAEVDAAHVQRHHEARVGHFVRLTLRDTGCGMPPEVVAHLFEPFFTTKDVGKGTGLGLATVYGIVQQHSGWIEVETAVGIGSEFRVFLPPAAVAVLNPVQRPENGAPATGHGTILLVEDEESVRQLAGVILTEHGYRVVCADCAKTALQVWASKADEIDLVFTDMVMPGGMSGRDLADELRKSRPDTKIVFTSGYSPSRYGQNQNLLGGLKFLPKPYNPTKLLHAIEEALETNNATESSSLVSA